MKPATSMTSPRQRISACLLACAAAGSAGAQSLTLDFQLNGNAGLGLQEFFRVRQP